MAKRGRIPKETKEKAKREKKNMQLIVRNHLHGRLSQQTIAERKTYKEEWVDTGPRKKEKH